MTTYFGGLSSYFGSVSSTTGLIARRATGTPLAGRFPQPPSLVTPRPTIDSPLPALQTALGAIGAALRDALPSLGGGRLPAAGALGAAARAVARGQVGSLGTASTLRATREVNEQASTVRTSSQALGLDTTSPGASSRLSSTAALGLDVTSAETSSRITSTAEANTMATSYGVVQATFSNGAATQGSLGNLSGVYAGTGAAASATSLTLQITSPGATIGGVPSLVSVKVTDQNGTNLGTYSGLLTTGQALSLGTDIGLSVAFTAGTTINGATTTFAVSRTTPTDVDANGTFDNADVNLRPRFANNQQVTAGSFTVNGTSVSVAANDSINTVLARINSTVAGVTASFSGDKVTIQSVDPSEDDIVLAGDTSGFLAALNLTGATTVTGNVRDDQQILSKTSRFHEVTTGSFTVNGATISVNAVTDSLQSIVDRINQSSAGVTASYDAGTDKLTLTTVADSEDDIVVANDTTGLLSAVELAGATTVKGNVRDDQQVLTKTTRFAGVSSGSFAVNGQSIAVNAATDTLQTLVTRINAAGAGVTAAYDAAQDKLVFTPGTAGATLVLEGDTSGFLAAAAVSVGAAGSRVNADAAFNGTGLNAPLLDPGASVGAGSFTVNGVTIAVAANDTLNSVLARITASAAGVTASFDAATETVRLTASRAGASPITAGNDTSGFLAAVKLDATAASTPGTSTLDSALATHAVFASVTSGALTVNGVAITIDPSVDTLAGVVAAVNGLDGVAASLDSTTGRVTIQAERPGGDLEVSDGTGLLAALDIPSGRIQGRPAAVRTVEVAAYTRAQDDPRAAATSVAQAIGSVNGVLDALSRASGASPVVRDAVLSALREAVATVADGSVSGLSVSRADTGARLVVDVEALATALARDPHALDAFVAAPQGLPQVVETVRAASAEAARAASAAAEPGRSTARGLGEKTAADVALDVQVRKLQLLDVFQRFTRPTTSGHIAVRV
jgi:hypothetical protein